MPKLVHSGRESNGNWVLDNAELGHLQTLLDDPCRQSVTDNQSETFSYHMDMTGNQYHLPDNKVQNEHTFSMNRDDFFWGGVSLCLFFFLKKSAVLYKDPGLVPSLHVKSGCKMFL